MSDGSGGAPHEKGGELSPASEGYPIKLVRDKTPEVINSSGDPGDLFYGPYVGDRLPWLKRKLAEEVAEYLIDGGFEELCDIVAVVEALCEAQGGSLGGALVINRASLRGGFHDGVMMYGRHPEFDLADNERIRRG